jgi:hypothetical protein
MISGRFTRQRESGTEFCVRESDPFYSNYLRDTTLE